LEAQGERLLQDLVTQEKNLVRKVEEAKAKAKAIVEQAAADAAKLVAEGQARAESAAKSDLEAATKEAEAARSEILRNARDGAGLLNDKANNNVGRATAMVLEKVLP